MTHPTDLTLRDLTDAIDKTINQLENKPWETGIEQAFYMLKTNLLEQRKKGGSDE